ncbi:hypothetical protein RUND412_005834 [Rhizina undulata]
MMTSDFGSTGSVDPRSAAAFMPPALTAFGPNIPSTDTATNIVNALQPLSQRALPNPSSASPTIFNKHSSSIYSGISRAHLNFPDDDDPESESEAQARCVIYNIIEDIESSATAVVDDEAGNVSDIVRESNQRMWEMLEEIRQRHGRGFGESSFSSDEYEGACDDRSTYSYRGGSADTTAVECRGDGGAIVATGDVGCGQVDCEEVKGFSCNDDSVPEMKQTDSRDRSALSCSTMASQSTTAADRLAAFISIAKNKKSKTTAVKLQETGDSAPSLSKIPETSLLTPVVESVIDTPEVVPPEINTSSVTETSCDEKSQQPVPELHCIDTSPAAESDLASADPCTMVPASELVVVAKDETGDKLSSPQIVERYTIPISAAAIELRSTIEISFASSYDNESMLRLGENILSPVDDDNDNNSRNAGDTETLADRNTNRDVNGPSEEGTNTLSGTRKSLRKGTSREFDADTAVGGRISGWGGKAKRLLKKGRKMVGKITHLHLKSAVAK